MNVHKNARMTVHGRLLLVTRVVEAGWLDNGPGWIGVLLPDVDAVLAVRPDVARRPGTWSIGVVGLQPEGSGNEPRIEVRGFFADVINKIGIPDVRDRLLAQVEQELEGAVAGPAHDRIALDGEGRGPGEADGGVVAVDRREQGPP